MKVTRYLLALGLVGSLAVLAAGPLAAHETRQVEGYDVTFGGADEPLVTGERMWLELEITDNRTGAPVPNQSSSLNLSVQTSGHAEMRLDVSEKHGEPGVYEAPIVFTRPGTYVVHVRGSIGGTEIHTHFEKTVQDRSELAYPANASGANGTGPTTPGTHQVD